MTKKKKKKNQGRLMILPLSNVITEDGIAEVRLHIILVLNTSIGKHKQAYPYARIIQSLSLPRLTISS